MSQQIVRFLIGIFFCLISLPAAASEATLQQVIATLEKGYANLQDLQADFNQTTTLAGFPKPQKGHGELALRRPAGSTAQFRFDYAVPKQSIISNGSQVWFYQPENKQVLVSSLEGMMKGGNSIGMAYLTGLGNVSQDFNAAFSKPARDKQGNYLLELTPRKPTPVLARLRLVIREESVAAFLADGQAKDRFPVASSVVVDASGTETRISYSKVRTNSGLPAARFNFKVPQGVEIIKP
ncbi:MAG: outer membrane lipoprotein carrier protein LolA [Geobacter sp.]|jgi:outer membrane lipoprotein carrier protein|nr:outer membrane lipoprotein carrier protein LolA [Geobacter sp.]